jgi:uncharacterized protein DUF1554
MDFRRRGRLATEMLGAGLVVAVAGCDSLFGLKAVTHDAHVPDIRDSLDAPVDSIDAATTKRIFVTSPLYDGVLGGLQGADNTCQSVADKVPLPGSYKAWLSDNATDAATRLSHATEPYVLVDGTAVAADWTGLVSGTLLHAIDQTEAGLAPSPPNGACGNGTPNTVWTGTGSGGASAIRTCADWTDNTAGGTGTVGRFDMTGADWTETCIDTCNKPKHLYCIEQ